MTKLTCDITKDLIPSYLENLCSEDSRQAVEDHLQTCEKCRSCLALLRETEFTAEEAEKGQLNYMKKVKRHFATKNALGVALLFVLSLTILFLYSSVSPGQEASLYCILFPVLPLGLFVGWPLFLCHLPHLAFFNIFNISRGVGKYVSVRRG